jgi:hypothetical protein
MIVNIHSLVKSKIEDEQGYRKITFFLIIPDLATALTPLAFSVGQEERSPSLKTSHLFPMSFQYISNVVSIHRCYAVTYQEKFLSSTLFTKVNYDESCHKGIQKEIQKI